MTRLRAWIRSFFGFSSTETNAFLVLLPLMVTLIFSEPAYRYWFVHQPQDFSKEKKELDSLISSWKWEEPDRAVARIPAAKLFLFNPNHVTKNEMIALGIKNLMADRIVNYRLKGGKFMVKKDFMKIYGMDTVLYEKLFPFIDLPEIIEPRSIARKIQKEEKPVFIKFDLNIADSSQLEKIYGIGPKLSRRIILYRNKLGGFISIDQLKEVYGLDSVVVQELVKKAVVDNSFEPRQIDINRATEKELGDHPYIKYKLAKAITAYRFQHGAYSSVADLQKIALIDEAKFEKIKPYLSANP